MLPKHKKIMREKKSRRKMYGKMTLTLMEVSLFGRFVWLFMDKLKTKSKTEAEKYRNLPCKCGLLFN